MLFLSISPGGLKNLLYHFLRKSYKLFINKNVFVLPYVAGYVVFLSHSSVYKWFRVAGDNIVVQKCFNGSTTTQHADSYVSLISLLTT